MLLNHATNLGKPTAGFRIYLNRNQQVQAITDTLITAGSWGDSSESHIGNFQTCLETDKTRSARTRTRGDGVMSHSLCDRDRDCDARFLCIPRLVSWKMLLLY